jgi:3-keto-disaccharide hydrolase
MKRFSVVAMKVLVVGFTVFGCAYMPGQSDSGWIMLIDGPNGLENWNQIGSSNWAVVDGGVQADKRTGKELGFLVSKNSYNDFIIRAEFWVSDNANSGIFLRCRDPKQITDKSCYEVNIYDQRPDPSFGTGAITNFVKVSPMPKAGGKWNTYEITAKGPQLVVVLNGFKTAELKDSSFASGPIALQHGAGVVKFRKVEIKPL